jgi:hypothetical protein
VGALILGWVSWPPRVRIEHLWLALPIAVVAWRGFTEPLPVLDFWWHLKAGEVIVGTGSIPRTDLFSFTAAGQSFVHQSWLTEVLYFLLYRLGGLPLLVTANTMLLVAALLPIYHLCWEATGTARVAACAAYLPAIALIAYAVVRPQVLSFVLFSVFYWVLSGPQRQRSRLLWLLPALMALWVNLHPAFVLGLVLLALFFLRAVTSRLLGASDGSPDRFRLGVALLASVLATLPNPEGPRVYAGIQQVIRDPLSQMFVVDWQPPRIDRLDGLVVFHGPFLAVLLALLGSALRPTAWESVLFLGFAAFGMKANRNGIWFSLVAAPILAGHLAGIDWGRLRSLQRYAWVDRLASSLSRPADPKPRYGLNAAIAGLALMAIVRASPWVYPRLGTTSPGTALCSRETPVGAMDYIQAHRLEGRIFHPQVYGDYLMWRLWPAQRTFVDGRVHLFDQSLARDYLLMFVEPHWEERLAKYHIRYLLLSRSAEDQRTMIVSARASPRWRLRYEDDDSVLFEKDRGVE